MLKKDSRWIQYYDLVLRSTPEKAPPIELPSLIQPLMAYFQKGEAVQLIDNDTAACRIVDLCHDATKGILTLLLQYADTEASDPAFSDLQTGTIRVEPKLDGEGIAVTAHMLISLSEFKQHSKSYVMLLEKVPGINRTRIERFLRHIFKEISEGKFFYNSEKGEEKGFRPLVEIQGYPSDSLKNALKSGDLKGIQLIRHEVINHNLDEDGYIQDQEYSVKIKVKPDLTLEKSWQAVTSLFKKAQSDHMDEMRIIYKDNQNFRNRSVAVDLTGDDLENTAFNKEVLVKLDKSIEICAENIRCDIIERMFDLLPSNQTPLD